MIVSGDSLTICAAVGVAYSFEVTDMFLSVGVVCVHVVVVVELLLSYEAISALWKSKFMDIYKKSPSLLKHAKK